VGGRIRVFHGLLRKLESEEALAALLAHEIAHVKHRHVAAGLGHGLAVALLLSVVSPEGGAQAAQSLLGGAAQWALLGYTREAERQADLDALVASLVLYGHGGGVAALFRAMPQAQATAGTAWLRTHPETAERLALLEKAAADRAARLAGPSTPLPAALRALPSKAPAATGLAVGAIEWVVAKLSADLDKALLRAGDPVDALGAWMAQAQNP
jgi:beta-barrel assembly-enhancing protease